MVYLFSILLIIITSKVICFKYVPTRTNIVRFDRTQLSSSGIIENGKNDVLDYNWNFGMCRNKIIFEGVDTIRRFRFSEDLLSFGFIDGRVCVINLTTGVILDKFNNHKGEVTAIDFDGVHLCSGGADGVVNIYDLSLDGSNKGFGKTKFCSPAHSRAVTGLKIIHAASDSAPDSTLLITCGMDKKLHCVNLHTRKTMYIIDLPSAPLCMDYCGSYLAIGFNNGKVLFLKARTGKEILNFRAHDERVRCLHFFSQSVVFTGDSTGLIRRWDLSGDGAAQQSQFPQSLVSADPASTVNVQPAAPPSATAAVIPPTIVPASSPSYSASSLRSDDAAAAAEVGRPTRYIDYYFPAALASSKRSLGIIGEDTDDPSPPQSSGPSGSVSSASLGSAFAGSSGSGSEAKAIAAGLSAPIMSAINRLRRGMATATQQPQQQQQQGSSDAPIAAVPAASAAPPPYATYKNARDYYDDKHTMAVVSVQGDDKKIVAAYEDGRVSSWSIHSGECAFDLEGRNSLISTVQFDSTRLLADGTYSILVTHDFSEASQGYSDDVWEYKVDRESEGLTGM